MHEKDYAAWNASRWFEVAPDIDPSSALLAVRFMRVAALLDRSQADTLLPWTQHGITSVDDFRTLAMIRLTASEGVTPTAVAEAMDATIGTISNRISRLERKGWIERKHSKQDRRSHLVCVPAGRHVEVDDMYRALVANHQRFFADLLASEERAMIKGLARLLPSIPDTVPQPA